MKNFLCLLYFLPIVSFSQSPNFSEDIAPIFYNKCTQCHHSGGVAPFSLIDYAMLPPSQIQEQFHTW